MTERLFVRLVSLRLFKLCLRFHTPFQNKVCLTFRVNSALQISVQTLSNSPDHNRSIGFVYVHNHRSSAISFEVFIARRAFIIYFTLQAGLIFSVKDINEPAPIESGVDGRQRMNIVY